MNGLERLMACFVAPAEPGAGASGAPSPAGGVSRAAVVGSTARLVVPVAGAVAGELRIRARAAAALVALWRPDAPHPSGAATPGARRLAARLGAAGVEAAACGRLAWLTLPEDPDEAARQAHRLPVIAFAPVVLGVCGPRPSALEPLLAAQDAAIAVLPADADPDLRELALAGLTAPVRALQPPAPPGPARWAALAGLSRLRALPPLEVAAGDGAHGGAGDQ